MGKVHLFRGHVAYVYLIDTVYVQNNLSTEFKFKDNFHNLKKNILRKLKHSMMKGLEKGTYLY